MTTLIFAIPLVLVVLFVLFVLSKSYVKAPPDKAIVISGLRKRVIIGRAGFMIPFLERSDELNLAMMSVDVKTGEAVTTNDYISVMVDGAVKVKINSEEKSIALAAENFLNKDSNYIVAAIKDVLEGNVREIIGSLGFQNMLTDRKSFSEKVQENAVPDLERMGLQIISFNIQSIRDIGRSGEEDGRIVNALGADNESKITMKAAVVKADSDKGVAVAQAAAKKEANDARIQSELEIEQKNTDLAIKKSELKQKADIARAIADSAYEIEKEEQRKAVEIKNQEANIVRQQKEVELARQEAEVREERLNAEIKKTADADLYSRQKRAEAEAYEREKEANAELTVRTKQAEAQRVEAEVKLFEQEQEAKAVEARGVAEARAIELKGLAEAKSIEAQGLAVAAGIEAKAEAMGKYNDAAVMEMYFNTLPEVAKSIASPLSQVDSITMYGEGNSAKMIQDMTVSMSQVMDGVSSGLGFDAKSLIAGLIGGKMAQNSNTKAPVYGPTVANATNIDTDDDVKTKALADMVENFKSRRKSSPYSNVKKSAFDFISDVKSDVDDDEV